MKANFPPQKFYFMSENHLKTISINVQKNSVRSEQNVIRFTFMDQKHVNSTSKINKKLSILI